MCKLLSQAQVTDIDNDRLLVQYQRVPDIQRQSDTLYQRVNETTAPDDLVDFSQGMVTGSFYVGSIDHRGIGTTANVSTISFFNNGIVPCLERTDFQH